MLNKSHKSNEILAFIPFGHKAQKMILSESSLITTNFDTETLKTTFYLSNLDELALLYNFSFYHKAFKAIDNILRNSNLSFIVISHSTLIFYSKSPLIQANLEIQDNRQDYEYFLSYTKLTNFFALGSIEAFSKTQNPCLTQLDHLANKQNAQRFAATFLPLRFFNRFGLVSRRHKTKFLKGNRNTLFEINKDILTLGHATSIAQFRTIYSIIHALKQILNDLQYCHLICNFNDSFKTITPNKATELILQLFQSYIYKI